MKRVGVEVKVEELVDRHITLTRALSQSGGQNRDKGGEGEGENKDKNIRKNIRKHINENISKKESENKGKHINKNISENISKNIGEFTHARTEAPSPTRPSQPPFPSFASPKPRSVASLRNSHLKTRTSTASQTGSRIYQLMWGGRGVRCKIGSGGIGGLRGCSIGQGRWHEVFCKRSAAGRTKDVLG